MSVQPEQVVSVLRRSIQEILSRGLNDPRVRGLISVTDIKISDDYAEATIAVSVLPAEHGALTLKGLHHAASHIRSQVARTVQMRRVPNFRFRLDESLKKQAELHAAINKAAPPVDDDGAAPNQD